MSDRKSMFFTRVKKSAYTVVNATYTGHFFNISAINYVSDDLILKPDGSKVIWLGIIPFQLNLSTNFNISTASYIGSYNQRPITGSGALSQTFSFNGDGTRLFIHSDQQNRIYQFNLSSAYNVTSCTSSGLYITVSANLRKMLFVDNGIMMYLLYDDRTLVEYILPIPYDILTASLTGRTKVLPNVGGGANPIDSIAFSPDFLRIFALAASSIYEIDLVSPLDVTTATYNGKNYPIVEAGVNTSMVINDTFTKLYIGNPSSDYKINEYDINNP